MLSIDLKILQTGCLLVCHGEVISAKEADYLLRLLIREDKGDVIHDLTGIKNINAHGLSVIIAAYEMLASCHRRLFLKSATADLVRALQQRHLNVMFALDSGPTTAPSSSVQ
jgi:anti-anti-sigma regulatory factor